MGRIEELKKRYEENQRRFFAPLANEYRKSGDLELAIALCRQHLAEAPNNLSGQIVFGQALFDSGTLDESRSAFETAIALDPENLIALRHLGDIARAQNDVPRAREWYQRVLDADRRNEDVLAIMEELKTIELDIPVDVPAEPEFAGEGMVDIESLVEPEPAAETELVEMAAAPPEPPASSFGFDVDLSAAQDIPASAEETGDFGVVELPVESAFGGDTDGTEGTEGTEGTGLTEGTDVTEDAGLAEGTDVTEDTEHPASLIEEFDAPVMEVYDAPVMESYDAPVVESYEAPAEPEVVAEASAYAEAAAPDDMLLDVDIPDAPPSPAAATPGDFDFELTEGGQPEIAEEPHERFATMESFDPVREMPTPIAPVTPVGSGVTVSTDGTVTTDGADSTDFTEGVPEQPAEEPAPAAHAEAFATETMAELYVRQGLRQEAIGVYEQLVAARPGDEVLQARLAELQLPASVAAQPATAKGFFASLATRKAVATPVHTELTDPADYTETAVYTDTTDSTDDTDHTQPVEEVQTADTEQSVPSVPSVQSVSPVSTLDALFGNSHVATPDDNAAQTLATAFGSEPSPKAGRPTRAASDELSLDRVFGDQTGAPRRGSLGVPRQSAVLRFDQFFSSPDAAAGDAPVSPPAEGGGESEQFKNWLTGLKKP